ncbi:MAG: flavin reductase family protein [Anaerolineae bacterium]|nr:flavin reductase family protein [Anaerolineae bacterium]MCO5196401.1 flavin reductase family protein [Anaerolineae bacterium]MCO5207168.1 flavin reductase family protein [Anaerolineae bacterium]
MSITSEAYRDALRHFPAGVTIVTILADGERHGLTVSAFASVSPTPPLIMVAIDHRHRAHDILQKPGATFAVNILHAEQAELSNRFAWVKDEDRFAEGNWTAAQTGAPVLADALAWLDCIIYAQYEAGTHTIFIGEVQASSTPRHDEPPLIYWNRSYRKLNHSTPAV